MKSNQNQQTNLPRVAAIMANYNNSEYILDAIKGVISSDYPNKSLTVIDDFSSDDSVQKILNIVGDIKPVKEDEEKTIYHFLLNNVQVIFICLKRNGGPSRARNVGINHVFGDHHLFIFTDSDDIVMPTKISEFVSKFLENPESLGIVYGDYYIINENGIVVYECKEPYSIKRLSEDCIIHSQSMVSRTALQKCGLFDESLRVCEDYSLWLRISDYFIATHIPKPLTYVRIHSKNASNSVGKERWQADYSKVKYEFMKRKGLIK